VLRSPVLAEIAMNEEITYFGVEPRDLVFDGFDNLFNLFVEKALYDGPVTK
jgi:hypothetical protein